jgi:hypothetical protein
VCKEDAIGRSIDMKNDVLLLSKPLFAIVQFHLSKEYGIGKSSPSVCPWVLGLTDEEKVGGSPVHEFAECCQEVGK